MTRMSTQKISNNMIRNRMYYILKKKKSVRILKAIVYLHQGDDFCVLLVNTHDNYVKIKTRCG